jgi:hypothetical protein
MDPLTQVEGPAEQEQYDLGTPDSTPDNPQQESATEQVQEQGITDDDKTAIVQLITSYRQQWTTDRLLRFPQWLKNTQMYKGIQVLGWDPGNNTYFDALAWYRQNGDSNADDTYLEKYINNITEMFGGAYIAALSRGVPPTVVRPENAENLADTTTAKAAQQAVGIIERLNDIGSMVPYENFNLYLYACYFKHTRLVIDGEWAGYNDVPAMEETEVDIPGRFHCKKCGLDTPETDITPGSLACPECGTDFEMDDYFEGGTEPQMTATIQKKPKGMVKWSVYGPMQVDADPKAMKVGDTPLLALEMEVDVGWLRMTFPVEMKEIKEGSESSTNPNASYERLVRNLVFSKAGTYTTDVYSQQPTYTQIWVQPQAFYRLQDETLIAKLIKMFPAGMKVMMCGPNVLRIVPASLTKEWTHCSLHDGLGLYPQPSPADKVVPFNERFNNESFVIDDYMERCSSGVVLADGRRLDVEGLNGKRFLPGVFNNVPTTGDATDKPLGDMIHQFTFALEPKAFDYLGLLLQWCQAICGITPQIFGSGTQEGVDTAKGQKQMLDQALEKLGMAWKKLKIEHAQASENAIWCLQQNKELVGDMWEVIEEDGSEFRNNYVHMDDLNGRIRVYPESDEGLPRSPEQIREWWINMADGVDKDPLKQAFWDVPSNQETYLTVVGVNDAVSPGAAMRSTVLQDIADLLKSPPIPVMGQGVGPDGQPIPVPTGQTRLPAEPQKNGYDFKVLFATLDQFIQENRDLKTKNPQGWANLNQYYDLAKQVQMQKDTEEMARHSQVMQAGQPKPPQTPPPVAIAQQKLLEEAGAAAEALTKIATGPMLEKGTGGSNVQAGKELIDTALKAASGGK